MAERLLDTEQAFREARRSQVVGSAVAGGIDLLTKTIMKHLENKRLSAEAKQRWRDQLNLLQARHGLTLEEIEARHQATLAEIAARGKTQSQLARLRGAGKGAKTSKEAKKELNVIANYEKWSSVERGKKNRGLFFDEIGRPRVDVETELPYIDPDTGKTTAAAKKLYFDQLANFIIVNEGTLSRDDTDILRRAANKAVQDVMRDETLRDITIGLSADKGTDVDIYSLGQIARFAGRTPEVENLLSIETEIVEIDRAAEEIKKDLPSGFATTKNQRRNVLAYNFAIEIEKAKQKNKEIGSLTLSAFRKIMQDEGIKESDFQNQVRSQIPFAKKELETEREQVFTPSGQLAPPITTQGEFKGLQFDPKDIGAALAGSRAAGMSVSGIIRRK